MTGAGADVSAIIVFCEVMRVGASGCLNHVLDSLNDGNSELLGFDVARAEPVGVAMLMNPVDLNGSLGGDDRGSFRLLIPVKDDG